MSSSVVVLRVTAEIYHIRPNLNSLSVIVEASPSRCLFSCVTSCQQCLPKVTELGHPMGDEQFGEKHLNG